MKTLVALKQNNICTFIKPHISYPLDFLLHFAGRGIDGGNEMHSNGSQRMREQRDEVDGVSVEPTTLEGRSSSKKRSHLNSSIHSQKVKTNSSIRSREVRK